MQSLPERPPLIPVDRPEKLGQVLGGVQDLLARGRLDEKCVRQLELVRDLLRRMPLSDCYAQLSRFQQEMAGDLLSRLHILKSIANPEPPTLTDLPASLVDRFVGQHGKYLLKIYGRGDIWDTNALGRFVKDVRTVDPHVTGNPLQAHEASLEMKHSYQEAAIYSLLVILGVLVLDFKSLHYAMLAALPLGVGVLQMFGLLGLLDIPLNPANLIALPLILGIGVDYGVHIVHEFREQNGPYRMSPGTAVAVLGRRADDARRLWLADDRLAPGLAKPGPRADARRDLLPVHVADHAAGAADLDHAGPRGKDRGSRCSRRNTSGPCAPRRSCPGRR